MLATFFSRFESDRIVQAIAAAEEKSSAEIRVHVTRRVPKDLEERALRRFHRLGMANTAARNGVLIYIAPRARRFRILGDAAIHEKGGDALWKDVASALEERFRRGEFTEGIVQAVERLGAVLAEHFPRGQDDKNELGDEVTED